MTKFADPPTDAETVQSLVERQNRLEELQRTELAVQPGPLQVELQLVQTMCWKCHKALAAIRGYKFEDVFISLVKVSDTSAVVAFVTDLRKQAPGISPVAHRYSKTTQEQYFAAECPWCAALFGPFFMTNAMFPSRLPLNCPYPSCYHQFPEIECDSFKYHPLTLNIGPQEAEDISQYRGLTR